MHHTAQTAATFTCIHELIKEHAKRVPGAVAIKAPGRPALSYGRLYDHILESAGTLRASGVSRNHRVALVLPSGPELAVATLAVASCAAAAPLDPSYREQELNAYLLALKADAVVVPGGADCAARSAAHRLGLPIIERLPHPVPVAGLFILKPTAVLRPGLPGASESDDDAFVLHTSGTTSRAKVVPLTHRNACTSARNIAASLELTAGDRCLNVMPLFHIHGLVGALLSTLTAGGSIICPPGFDASRFFEWLHEYEATWYTAVPAIHRTIVGRAPATRQAMRHPLRFIRSSSSPLSMQLQEELERVFGVPVVQAYGMTEAAHQIASNPLPPRARKAGSVGVPTGVEVAVMDEAGRLLGRGETGEIVIRGETVMRGYDDAESSEQVFASGWFRTGDQGFIDREGYLVLTGRLKELINRGGKKIAPVEIDDVLLRHPAVVEALTFAVPHPELGEEVAAAVVLREGTQVTQRELQEFVAGRLADFKIPRRIAIVAAIPKSSTGKPVRAGIAQRLGIQPPIRKINGRGVPTQPGTELEQQLVNLWKEVLGVNEVGVHDDFLQLGGDSLMAARLLSRVREATGTELSIVSLFDAATVADLAKQIEVSRLLGPPAPVAAIPALGKNRAPLSFAQQRLWFTEQLSAERGLYQRPAYLRLLGPLNADALERSLNEIVARHEALRTTIEVSDGQPYQVVRAHRPISLKPVDLTSLPEAERESRARDIVREEARRPFDLASGPLLRATLVRLHDTAHWLLLTIHHIVFDGWSAGVLVRELATLYEAFSRGISLPLPALPIQYADFATWERKREQEGWLAPDLEYWTRRLHGAPELLPLPTDNPRPAVRTFGGAEHTCSLPTTVTQALRAVSAGEGATLFMALLATFQALLRGLTRSDELIVGTDVANRNTTDVEGLIGLFVNQLVLRTDLGGDPTFRELLRRTRQTVLEAQAHQALPFDRLVEVLNPRRGLDHAPLFQVLFVLQPSQPALERCGVVFLPLDVARETANFDLAVFAEERDQGLRVTWNYATDLFDASTISRMADDLAALLARAAETPDARLSELERRARLSDQGEVIATPRAEFRMARRKPVDLSGAPVVTSGLLQADQSLPLVIAPETEHVVIEEWARENREFIDARLHQHGALLFRGFGLSSPAEFERVALGLCPTLFGDYGDLPRERLGDKIYSSTPYPADQMILFHNEGSHLFRWPMRIFFFCAQPAREGGETPIVDCREIYRRLDPGVLDRLTRKGLMYVRNFVPGVDVGWQEFFQTSDRRRVEETCRSARMICEWTDGNGLRIRQTCPAVARHPRTQEMVFFNQIQLHHISFVEPRTRESLLALFDETSLPRHVYYGDGSPIEADVVAHVAEVYRAATVAFPWRRGDLLMLDNMLVAHARSPYVGPRKIVVAMGEMISQDQLVPIAEPAAH